MRASTSRPLLLSALALLSSAAVVPGLLAQARDATIPVAGAEAFLGAWAVNADGDTGPVTLRVTLTDDEGRLMARITGGAAEAEGRTVQRISRTAAGGLAIGYTLNMQGQPIPTVLTFTPEGAAMRATINLADGMLVLTGDARKDP